MSSIAESMDASVAAEGGLVVDVPAPPEAPALAVPPKPWEDIEQTIRESSRSLGSQRRGGGLVTVLFVERACPMSRQMASFAGSLVVGGMARSLGKVCVCDVGEDEKGREILQQWTDRDPVLRRVPAIAFLHCGRPVWIRYSLGPDVRVHCGPIAADTLTRWAEAASRVGTAQPITKTDTDKSTTSAPQAPPKQEEDTKPTIAGSRAFAPIGKPSSNLLAAASAAMAKEATSAKTIPPPPSSIESAASTPRSADLPIQPPLIIDGSLEEGGPGMTFLAASLDRN